jgi:hypothetical protein
MSNDADDKVQTDRIGHAEASAPRAMLSAKACFYNWERVHEEHKKVAMAGGCPPSAKVVRDLGIISDPQGTLKVKIGDRELIDFIGAYHLFKALAGDNLDIVSFLIDPRYLTSIGSGSTPIYNDTDGIGLPIERGYRKPWSSDRLLHHTHHTPPFTLRGMLHELGHLWLAYVNVADEPGRTKRLLHEDFPFKADPGQPQRNQAEFHWGRWMDHANSSMSYDRREWRKNDDGTFTSISHWADEAVGTYFGYSELDQYLMGFISKEAVGNWFVLPHPTPPLPVSDDVRSSGPHEGEKLLVSVDDVIALHGARKPDYVSSQRVFRQGFCIITSDAKEDPLFVGQCQHIVSLHEANFRRATAGRAVVDTRLLRPNQASISIGRGKRGDVAGPDIWVRNSNDKGDAHESPMAGQSNWIRVRVRNDSAEKYDGVTVNVYAVEGPHRTFHYPDDWRPDQLIGSCVISVKEHNEVVVELEWRPGLVPADQYASGVLLAELMPLDPALRERRSVEESGKLAVRAFG